MTDDENTFLSPEEEAYKDGKRDGASRWLGPMLDEAIEHIAADCGVAPDDIEVEYHRKTRTFRLKVLVRSHSVFVEASDDSIVAAGRVLTLRVRWVRDGSVSPDSTPKVPREFLTPSGYATMTDAQLMESAVHELRNVALVVKYRKAGEPEAARLWELADAFASRSRARAEALRTTEDRARRLADIKAAAEAQPSPWGVIGGDVFEAQPGVPEPTEDER